MAQFVTGEKDVASAGTPERVIDTETLIISGVITAKSTNSDALELRDAEGGIDGGTLNPGERLEVGSEWVMDLFDLSTIFLNVAGDGDGVKFFFWK